VRQSDRYDFMRLCPVRFYETRHWLVAPHARRVSSAVSVPFESEMSNQLPLILSVADLAYSGGEMFELLGMCLETVGFRADLRSVALTDVVETVSRLQPALILIGHRPLLDDEAMRERWEVAGSPMGGDIIKALKSNTDTKDIPLLLVEGLVRIEEVATESGADAYITVPFGPQEITEAIKKLVETVPNSG